ncbi:acyl-CoA dehydrogenase family protein [Pseudonocardia endophytica]|uniref:Alkylation response protein AidB-like acyl-CoA dehydrogenase n=1 Tax=Pseudonocardia endophytica TaxID=401976 RepID=A0A4R1HXV4_PSEEN|nr:acyl-CoA dehydrogenase family protein [Pseudonocardia endophytica]TCK26331.1 alkylation response protein AidB-like acyl-CoA dehydrogenase [Pseudonocardia endophytica]
MTTTTRAATTAVFDPLSAEYRELLAELAEGAGERDATRGPLQPFVRRLRDLGLGAARVPRAAGGAGLGVAELFGVVHELAQADPNLAHSLRNHFLFVEGLLRPGASDRRRRWLPGVLRGELHGGSFNENGSAPAGSTRFTTALRSTPDGLVLDGEKIYSTGNLYFQWISVTAAGPDGATVSVIVPSDRPGVEVLDDWDGIGQRLTGSGTTRFRDVAVAPDEVSSAREGSGGPADRRPYEATYAQLWLTTTIAGIVRAAERDAVALVIGRRRNYYHGVAPEPRHEPALQEVVGRIGAAAHVADTAVRDAARRLEAAWADDDPDPDLHLAASLAAARTKIVVDGLALDTATALFDAGGASATKASAHLDRHWRNVRTLASHNPASYKARVLGDHALNGTLPPDASFF